ncbi:MAG: hypothetical protein WC658_05575 [Candidatus Omnitrophota bacterium]
MDYGIRSYEAAYLRVVIAGSIKVEAGIVQLFAGEEMLDRDRPLRGQSLCQRSIRSVFIVLDLLA